LSSKSLHKQKNGLKRNSKIFSKKTLSCLVLSVGITSGGIPLISETNVFADSNSWDFQYTGAAQSWSAPEAGTYKIEVWGAQGGGEGGANGGYSTGTINLSKGDSLYVYVGQKGLSHTGNDYRLIGSGGGATDIRTASDGNWQDDLSQRIIVAGGGGGGASDNDNDGRYWGGVGGGLNGGDGEPNWASNGQVGLGASQTGGGAYVGYGGASGSFGIGADASPDYSWWTDQSTDGGAFNGGGLGRVESGGGGGGWYGGGAAGSGAAGGGGGGGSSYIGGVQNGDTHSGNENFTAPNGSVEDGQSGDGYTRITLVKPADSTPPVTTDNAPTSWVNKDVTVNLNATDNDGGSGVADTYYTLDGGSQQSGTSVNVSGEGVHTLTYWSVDNNGNTETQHTVNVKIDETAPITTDNTPTGWVNKDVTINLNATDKGGSGVADTYYTLDGGSQQSGTSVNLTAEGTHTIEYWSVDNAGNAESHHTATVNIDKTAPVTALSTNPNSPNGKNGWYTSDVQVSLNPTDSGGSGTANTEYRINGGAWTPYNGAFTVSTDGTYTIDYRSTDNAGNTEQFNTKTIKLDKTAPSLNVSLDKTTIWSPNHKMVPITATINDSDSTSGIDSVVLTSITSNEPLQSDDIQGATYNTPTGTTDTFELRADRLGSGNGRIYTITFTVSDKAGNVTTKSVTVTVPHDQSNK
jgi:hypothetical protein